MADSSFAPTAQRAASELVASQLVNCLESASLPNRVMTIVRETAERYDVSTCLLTLCDTSSASPLTFKCVHGPCAASATDRRKGCNSNLTRPCKREVATIILNAAGDSRFAQDDLVTFSPNARLYVGVPIVVSHAGMRCFIGTLCL